METEKKLFPKDTDDNAPKEEIALFSREQRLNRNQGKMNIIQNPSSQNQMVISNYSMGNNQISRLMNTKYVRIYINKAFACVTGCNKLVFNINSVIGRDDKERKNETEEQLFFAEERTHCDILCFGCCAPYEITFEFYDITNNNKELFSISQITQLATKISECCEDTYYTLPPIYNYKANDTNNRSNISRYDTRSIYRTYDYMGQSYYKIGKPYIPIETNCCCCCSCKKKEKDKCCDCNCCCCCCSCEEITDKRIYIDIFNMQDQKVGKFAIYYESGCCCCTKRDFFMRFISLQMQMNYLDWL